MKNIFENSLPVGLVMSLYDFDIPGEKKTTCPDGLAINSFYEKEQTEYSTEPDDLYEQTWMNGELSWKL